VILSAWLDLLFEPLVSVSLPVERQAEGPVRGSVQSL
jgi:hypothetical protein